MKSKIKDSKAAQPVSPHASGRSWSGRQATKRSRREQILRSVGEVLSDSRLSSLSMVDIANRLGITKGNLYYYFKDKQDILYQCHMRSMDISLDALAALDPAASPDQRLLDLLVSHIKGVIDGGLGGLLLTDLESLSNRQRQIYVSRRDQFEAGVRRIVDEGVAKGVLECENSKLASLTILGAINWIPKWFRVDGPLGSEEVATGMARMLMRSVQPAAPASPTLAPQKGRRKMEAVEPGSTAGSGRSSKKIAKTRAIVRRDAARTGVN